MTRFAVLVLISTVVDVGAFKFVCRVDPLCGKRFARGDLLSRHEERHLARENTQGDLFDDGQPPPSSPAKNTLPNNDGNTSFVPINYQRASLDPIQALEQDRSAVNVLDPLPPVPKTNVFQGFVQDHIMESTNENWLDLYVPTVGSWDYSNSGSLSETIESSFQGHVKPGYSGSVPHPVSIIPVGALLSDLPNLQPINQTIRDDIITNYLKVDPLCRSLITVASRRPPRSSE